MGTLAHWVLGLAVRAARYLHSLRPRRYPWRRRVDFAPRVDRDGWVASRPGETGLEPLAVEEFYRRLAAERPFRNILGAVVSHRGALAAEAYFRGWSRSRPNNVKSVTKSVLSLLLGIAADEGIISIEQPIGQFLPRTLFDADPRKFHITIAQLLTMQAGLAWDEWAEGFRDAREMLTCSDTVQYVLRKQMVDEPGVRFRYSTGTSQLLGCVLRNAAGMSLLEFARTRLFDPLEMGSVFWWATPDGLHCGGAHLFLTLRQMTRIGELCREGGIWRGHRLVKASWIELATSIHSGRDWWEGPYGFHWWIRPEGYAAYGYGGQLIYVAPKLELVVAVTADADTKAHIPIADVEALLFSTVVTTRRGERDN